MSDSVELLFFDTFAHDNTEELNLDLVQFPKPVYVTEVRIIPLGARVQADFPGGVRLGATNPSQFQIEFFVNDLGKPGASTFETLGGFEYDQNGCINLNCTPDESVRKIPTDGLVLRGWYTTITLAVYGTLTANITEQIIPPVVTPSISTQPNTIADVQQIISSNTIKNEWPPESIQPIEYSQPAQATTYPQTYPQTEAYAPEYTDYYNDVPKDPRSYHHTPETEWDGKNRRSSDVERDRERDRGYQKTGSLERDHHSSRTEDRRDRDRDANYRERQTSRERDWEHERQDYRDRDREWEREKDRDRSYKHQDGYRRSYGRSDEREERKRPRTPPVQATKRPHTPHGEHKEHSPVEVAEVAVEEEAERGRVKEQVVEAEAEVAVEAASPVREESVQMDVEEFEPILSDEDILDDGDHYQEIDYDYNAYTNNDDLIKLFVPGVNELRKYKAQTVPFKVADGRFEISENLRTSIGIADDFFKSSITKYSIENFERLNKEIKEEFIHLCDRIYSNVGSAENFCHIVKLYDLFKSCMGADYKDADKELVSQVQYITETMIDWLQIALSFKMANEQDQPGYKIRHIKNGVRLTEWCCTSLEFLDLLWKHRIVVHEILLDLYEQEFMALSIKLMILRALDAYLLKKPSIELYLAGKPEGRPKENGFHDHAMPFCERNGYKCLVELVRRNPSVRLKFALNSILKKLNLYEVLCKLHEAVGKLHALKEGEGAVEQLNLVIRSLEQILSVCQSGCFVLSQPRRFLPVPAQFEINRSDTADVLVEFFEKHSLLQCFALLLSMPATVNLPPVKTHIYEILSELIHSPEGLQYLSENCETVNVLLKCLLQTDEEMQFAVVNTSHQLGLEVAYKLQCLYHMECLLDLGPKHRYDPDAPEVIEELHAMFCLTFSGTGKFACAEVLSMKDNVQCLLQFLDVTAGKDKDSQLSRLKKSPGVGYIIDLIAFTVTCATNVPFLETYSKQLLGIVNQREVFDVSATVKLNDIASFLKPTENPNFTNYDNISPLVECITRCLESITSYPGQLITSLRIIQHLGIPTHSHKSPVQTDNPFNNYVELKYKHVILQLFSSDGISLITKILQRICDHYEQPALHSYVFVSAQSVNIVNTIEPCVGLLKQMLTYIIQCRNMQFKDLTSIPVLLQTYNLLHAFPAASPVISKARKIRNDLVDTLLVYTQPFAEEVHEKDSLNKTLWTLMCGEVIKYTITAPYTFISGLLILSELLPLPLPIQSREVLSKEETTWLVNLRKLWSAHLHPHSSAVQDLINRLCVTSHQPLLNLVRRVCVQLSDLAANSAVTIARGVLDSVHGALNASEDETQPCGGNLPRLLNFLACLVTHGPLKCAVLQLIHGGTPGAAKSDEKYPAIVSAFVRILKTRGSTNSHVQAQECVLSVFQSLCDSENTLLQVGGTDEKLELSTEVYLANALPIKDLLLTFLQSMVEHLQGENSFVTFLPIVRTFLLLTEHNYGFYHMREVLSRTSEPFAQVLKRLVRNVSKDSVECLSTLNALVELLRVCATVEEVEGQVLYSPRDIKMSVVEIRALVGWRVEEGAGDTGDHPLISLEELLKNMAKDDTTFDSLADGLTELLKLLNGTVSQNETAQEPILAVPEPLLVQFSGRQIFTAADTADDRLNSTYWLGVPTDESDADPENVVCDLTEVCKQYLPPELNLVREVEKLCRICPSDDTEESAKEKRNEMQKDKMKRPFVTPIRGRGFARTIPQRADLFRSRPPNTSRPPSVHVDDFVALETCGAQPTGPTGYNKISRELLATSRVARGTRGRAFMTSERAGQYRQMSWWSAGMGRGPYQ